MILLFTASCAHQNAAQPSSQNVCTDGVMPLTFHDGMSSIRSIVLKSLEWPLAAAAQCDLGQLRVVGLAEPSTATLAGRRATAVAGLLAAVGLPPASFDAGSDEDQRHPHLVIESRPR